MKFSYIAYLIKFRKLSIAIYKLYNEEGHTTKTENQETASSSLKVNKNPPCREIGGKLACLKLDTTWRKENNLPLGI